MNVKPLSALVLGLFVATGAHAAPQLIAMGSLNGSSDLSGLTGMLENGVDAANVLGGMGSSLAWAGGSTFLALPDRGPNATTWNAAVDNTTSYISRFNTVNLALSNTPSGGLPMSLTATLTGTTLLYSPTALNYGAVTPAQNTAGKFYFSGRSDNFLAGSNSTNPANARLDPEGIRMSNDGKSVFITDEYGPYVYQFDRATGARTNTYALPAAFTAANLSSQGAVEISGNTSGRVANKGMEGLAITPDGKTLVGFEQSPLIQDGGDGRRANRIVSIDIATGATKQYVYDNQVGGKNYNSSEILAVNDHQFLVLERDGKGLGGSTGTPFKRIFQIDLTGATDIGALGISGEANLLPYAVSKTLFLDLRAALNAKGFTDANIQSKLEGLAFGDDIVVNGQTMHTLWVANDNDFIPGTAGGNNFYVFAFNNADLPGFTPQNIAAAVPEPDTYAMMLAGLGLLGLMVRRRKA